MKKKFVIYSLLVKIATTLIPSVLNIILINQILVRFGSDTNGFISTINQILNLLTIFEAGFTLATIVSLYKPYIEKNYHLVNSILSATKFLYERIGFIILFFTIILTILIPYLFKTDLNHFEIRALFLISSSGLFFQFFFFSKYTIMFSVSNKEYLVQLVSLIFNIIALLVSIYVIYHNGTILTYKFLYVFIPFVKFPIVLLIFKRHFKEVQFVTKFDKSTISLASKEVMVQKLAYLILTSTDLIIISIILGTKFSSVYGLYNMIYMFIKGLVSAFVISPQNAFGQLYAEKETEKLSKYYTIYRFITVLFSTILLTSSSLLITPFLKLYTSLVNDIDYINLLYVVFFSIVYFFQILSDIFGGFANTLGQFKQMKIISITGSFVNILLSLLLVKHFGIVGVLFGTVVSYLYMIIFQIILVHKMIFKSRIYSLFFHSFSNLIIIVFSIIISGYYEFNVTNYFEFFATGFLTLLFISFIIIAFNMLFYRKFFSDLIYLSYKYFTKV